MTTNMTQIISLIEDSIQTELKNFIPRIANRKLSFHELESIFLGHGNGHKLFMEENDDEAAWEKLTQKQKSSWNAKAKKSEKTETEKCAARKRDGTKCTTKAIDKGLCGKHKDYKKSSEVAKKLAEEQPKEIKMKRKKIDGKFYLIDTDNKVFDIKTKELQGIYNPETKKIEVDAGDDFFENSSIDGEDNEGSVIVDSDEE